jgi:hypothetical protein
MLTKTLILMQVTNLSFSICEKLKNRTGVNIKTTNSETFLIISLQFSLIMDEQASGFVYHCRDPFNISCTISIPFGCSHIISVRPPF